MRSSWADVLAALPLSSPAEIVGERRVLVIAPHPDDETLGCGGLLAWAARTGRTPRVLFLTDGDNSHPGSARFPPTLLGALRRTEAVAACQALGIGRPALTFLGYPDGGLSSLEEPAARLLKDEVTDWIHAASPCAAFVTAGTDPHGDHEAAFNLVRCIAKEMQQVKLFAYPVWTWTREDCVGGVLPVGCRLETSDFVNAKRAAIGAYRSQLGQVVDDAEESFILPQRLIQYLTQDYEVVLDVPL